MFYGIEQSTDLRDRRTAVKKFASESALRRWIGNGGDERSEAVPVLRVDGGVGVRAGQRRRDRGERQSWICIVLEMPRHDVRTRPRAH